MAMRRKEVVVCALTALIIFCIYLFGFSRSGSPRADKPNDHLGPAVARVPPQVDEAPEIPVSLAYNPNCANFPPQEPLPCVNSRVLFPVLLEWLGLEGEGAEIGVQNGYFSKRVLTGWKKCTKYYAVDPWMWQETYDDGANVNQAAQNGLYQKSVAELAPFQYATVMRLTSEQAAKMIPDESLTFVYIDARHDYTSVLQDLNLWYPKLKRGGIMAGHDYIDIDEMPEWRVQPDGSVETLRAVKSAVNNFTMSVCRQLCIGWDESNKFVSFYFAK